MEPKGFSRMQTELPSMPDEFGKMDFALNYMHIWYYRYTSNRLLKTIFYIRL